MIMIYLNRTAEVVDVVRRITAAAPDLCVVVDGGN